jgi:rRNA maturation protein Nop10
MKEGGIAEMIVLGAIDRFSLDDQYYIYRIF